MTNRLRRGREICGLSIGQAARMLCVDRAWLSAQETEPPTATPEQLKAIADLYGTSVAWLLGAEPVIPADLRKMLRDSDVSFSDREALLETFGMIHTRDDG